MSITLLTAPDQYSFSKDFINAEFKCSGYLQQIGRASINNLTFNTFPGAGGKFSLIFGSNRIEFSVSVSPGEKGTEIPANATSTGQLLPYFKKNFLLNRDYDIAIAGNNIISFTSKKKSLGFDITISEKTNVDASITVVQKGLPELKKPNYSISFRLFVENINHSGFDMVYDSNLLLRNDREGIAIAQISDKLHQVMAADIDRFGIEIPTTGVLACKRTNRKYYFEYAESYGETIAVQQVHVSQTYNVIFGAQSYQARNSKKLQSLLSPSLPNADRYLKQGRNIQFTREDQPQFLFFYNLRGSAAGARLVAKRYFSDGTSDTSVLAALNLDLGRKYGFNVSYGNVFSQTTTMEQYEIYLLNSFNERISEKQTYVVDRKNLNFKRIFLNYSSWGGIDSRVFTGKWQSTLSREYETADRIPTSNYRLIDGQRSVFGLKVTEKFKASTGFIDRSVLNFNKDFLLSNLVFRFLGRSILPVVITSTSIDQPSDETFLCAQSFEYEYLYDDDAYSESDEVDSVSLPSALVPVPIGPIIIYAGTPTNPSLDIVQQQIS